MRLTRPHLALALIAAMLSPLLLCGCNPDVRSYSITSRGNPRDGKRIIQAYGCGACHIIPGVREARGLVGPPLIMYSQRTIVAGELPNTPDNLARWIQHPREIEPATAMPDLGLNPSQSYDVAAYLYTLR